MNDYRRWEAGEAIKCMDLTWGYERWPKALRGISSLRETGFAAVLRELCGKALAVVLLGSRARGDNTPLSDWDLLAVTPTGQYKLEALDVGLVAWLPPDKLDEILERSTIVLDAFADGKLLCGDPEVFDKARERAIRRGEGPRQTKSGWASGKGRGELKLGRGRLASPDDAGWAAYRHFVVFVSRPAVTNILMMSH